MTSPQLFAPKNSYYILNEELQYPRQTVLQESQVHSDLNNQRFSNATQMIPPSNLMENNATYSQDFNPMVFF